MICIPWTKHETQTYLGQDPKVTSLYTPLCAMVSVQFVKLWNYSGEGFVLSITLKKAYIPLL